MAPAHLHATAVLLSDRGVLVSGASGAGKTRLALTLIREAAREGRLGRLVSDDQVLLEATSSGRLLTAAPPAIAGLCEIRGLGVVPMAHEPVCIVDLLVRLVPGGEAPRMAGAEAVERLEGCPVPVLRLAERDAEGGALAVAGWLFGAAGRHAGSRPGAAK